MVQSFFSGYNPDFGYITSDTLVTGLPFISAHGKNLLSCWPRRRGHLREKVVNFVLNST